MARALLKRKDRKDELEPDTGAPEEAPPTTREPTGVPAAPGSRSRDERVFNACDCVIDLASALFGVSGRELRKPGRCADEVSRVRQIAIYVAHVVIGLNMTDLGKGFGRDRTTAMHACHLIEDLRDEPEFDRIVSFTEKIVEAAFRGRDPI